MVQMQLFVKCNYKPSVHTAKVSLSLSDCKVPRATTCTFSVFTVLRSVHNLGYDKYTVGFVCLSANWQ